jgi:hypothetical protein
MRASLHRALHARERRDPTLGLPRRTSPASDRSSSLAPSPDVMKGDRHWSRD